jgi:hypothetical protein
MSHDDRHGAEGGGHGHGAPLEPIGWMDRPDTVRRFFLVFYVICALLVVAELVLGKETEHPHPYEWPAFFYAAYGFVSFWFLVLVAKPMRKLLIRSEDYYDE